MLSSCPFNIADPNAPSLGARTQGSIDNRGGLEEYLASYENTWRIVDERAATPRCPDSISLWAKTTSSMSISSTSKSTRRRSVFDATFEEFDGYKHEWRFWDMAIQRALTFFGLDQTDAGNTF